MIHQNGPGRCMIREMPPGAEWTLYYAPGDGVDFEADFERLRGHPEIRDLHYITHDSGHNRIRIQFVDDVHEPRDPIFQVLRPRRYSNTFYGWASTPADPTARLRETLTPSMLQHARPVWDGASWDRLRVRDPIPAEVQPVIDIAPNHERLAETRRLARIRREVAMMVPDPDFPPLPLGPDSINLSPEMMAEYRLRDAVPVGVRPNLRQEVTVLGPDIGNPAQWWRRQADGVLGRTVSRPVNGIVRLQGFANAGATLDVPFDTFIRDWMPVEHPSSVLVPEPEPPTFWDRLLAEDS